MRTLFAGVLVFFIFAPRVVGANFSITEIMYDLPGSDERREWIEIVNTSSTSMDATTLSFFENGVAHRLGHVSGTGVIPPGGFAIIASDANTFLLDHPGYGGIVFDSSFSLSNTGETLALYVSGAAVYEISYSKASGGAGDGRTLNLSDGGLVPRKPTPGAPVAVYEPPILKPALPASPMLIQSSASSVGATSTSVEGRIYEIDRVSSGLYLWWGIICVALLLLIGVFWTHNRHTSSGFTIVDLGSDFDD